MNTICFYPQLPKIEMQTRAGKYLYDFTRKEWLPESPDTPAATIAPDLGADDSLTYQAYLNKTNRKAVVDQMPFPVGWTNRIIWALIVAVILFQPGCSGIAWEPYIIIFAALSIGTGLLYVRFKRLYAQYFSEIQEREAYWLDLLAYKLYGYQLLTQKCMQLNDEDWLQCCEILVEMPSGSSDVRNKSWQFLPEMKASFYQTEGVDRRIPWQNASLGLYSIARGSLNRANLVELIGFLKKLSDMPGVSSVFISTSGEIIHQKRYVEPSGGG